MSIGVPEGPLGFMRLIRVGIFHLLFNAELAAGAVLSILKDSDLKRSVALPVEEALALSLQGITSVTSCVLLCLLLSWV